MNKVLQAISNGQTLSDLVERLSGKWLQRTTASAPPQPPAHLGRHENIEAILRQLIAIPTLSGKYEANHNALSYIDTFLSVRGMEVTHYTWNGVESLVATTPGNKKPRVMLSAHLDVVPGAPELFELRKDQGKFYGRGVFDMKFAIALFMQAVEDIKDTLRDYDFGIMITSDEEVGGFDGVSRLVDEEGYLPKVVVLPDGGDNWHMETFAKGLWHFSLNATGKNAHGSRPWEGESAIEKLMAALADIKKLFPEQSPDSSTVTIGMMSGGKVINQVADKASASLDIRFNSTDDEKRLRESIEKISADYGLTIDTDAVSSVCINDPANPLLQSFAESIRTVTGTPPGTTKSFGLTDARFFTAHGIPCAIVRPPGGNLHGPGEWISEAGLYQMLEVLEDYLRKEARR